MEILFEWYIWFNSVYQKYHIRQVNMKSINELFCALSGVYSYNTSQSAQAASQMLNRHMWVPHGAV